ncbi:hypothetical protein LY78DRAFT_15696 [Colletotrichum sublineola]|nr:hypothetical protein LY78DRAFT_15696 [Colletotrichum sublineola]
MSLFFFPLGKVAERQRCGWVLASGGMRGCHSGTPCARVRSSDWSPTLNSRCCLSCPFLLPGVYIRPPHWPLFYQSVHPGPPLAVLLLPLSISCVRLVHGVSPLALVLVWSRVPSLLQPISLKPQTPHQVLLFLSGLPPMAAKAEARPTISFQSQEVLGGGVGG